MPPELDAETKARIEAEERVREETRQRIREEWLRGWRTTFILAALAAALLLIYWLIFGPPWMYLFQRSPYGF